MEDFSALREQMVRHQLKSRGIDDDFVLEAMRRVQRHRFVPQDYEDAAYADSPVPIEEGQTVSQPYMVALMSQLLQLHFKDKVLEIGTGSGYQTAVLAEIVSRVYTVEFLPVLADRAKRRLWDLGYKNISFRTADGFWGWPEEAPFDAVLVACGVSEVPASLIEQLSNGGRLVIPAGSETQQLRLLLKQGHKIVERQILPVKFVRMQRKKEL